MVLWAGTARAWSSGMIGARRSRPLPMRRGLLVLLAALFVVILPFAGTAGRLAAAELQPLEIASKSGVHIFAVEMASPPAEEARGLMDPPGPPGGPGRLVRLPPRTAQCFLVENTFHPPHTVLLP